MVRDLSDRSVVCFDDERMVANAGVMLPALLAQRLGIEALVDTHVDLGERQGGANPGRKALTMLSAMALGADCLEDCDVLRSGRTAAVLGHRVAAPSTLGTFLRAFTFGHVRQLDRVLADSLKLLSTRFRPDTRLDRGGQDVGSHGGSDGRRRRRRSQRALRRAGRSSGGRPGGALERAAQAGGGLAAAARAVAGRARACDRAGRWQDQCVA